MARSIRFGRPAGRQSQIVRPVDERRGSMLIGIISDTHDRVQRTERAVAALVDAGAEALIHCGDLTGPEVVAACGLLPSYYVFGNNDFHKQGLRAAMAE